jgi:hypothetical protein
MSGCGWLIPFYFGVIDAMKARGVMNNSSIYAGTSAGSLASLVATCDLDCKEVMVTLTRLAKDPAFTFDKNLGLKGVLKNLLPPDALERCQGRLHVTLTKVWPSPGSDAVIISNFTSLEHLVDVVAASCFIPLYSAQQLAVQIGNHPDHYIDGGVFAFMPPIGDVTISPFPQRFIYDLLPIRPDPRNASRAACIYLDKRDFPLRKLLPWVLLPPPEEGMWELFHRGEEAANRWMDRNAVSAGSSDEAKGSSKVRRISAVDVATPLPEERK